MRGLLALPMTQLLLSIAINVLVFNEGAEKIFGYTASEVLGKPLDLLLPSRYTQVHHQHVQDFGKSPKKARRMAEEGKFTDVEKMAANLPLKHRYLN